MPDDRLPDDFPLPTPPGEGDLPPWAQRAAPGLGGADGLPPQPPPDELPAQVCSRMEAHELATVIADQTDLAYYGVPVHYQPPQGQAVVALDDNRAAWEHFFREDLYDTRRVRLEAVHLFEWFPLSPGRFHTGQAAQSRRLALEHLVRGADGQTWFTPGGKASMIAGGLGAVRLRPRLVNGEPHYFMTASSNGVCHEGFPVLLPRRFYAQVKPRLLAEGAAPVTLEGEMRYLSGDLPDFFGQKRELPRLLLHVDKLTLLPRPRAEVTRYLVTAAVAFLGQVEGRPGPYLTYASFDPSSRASLQQAVDWLENFYLRQYQGQVITDFDEVMPRFPQAVFGLADVMTGRLAADRARAFLSEQGLAPDRAGPYFVIYNQTVRQIHTGGGAYVEGSVYTEGGDFVGRDRSAP